MQGDFGGFDPAFVGVTLRFQSQEAWGRFQQIAASHSPVPVAMMADDERFEALSLASVISHETRHYHDFLLSPYSARVFGLRVKALLTEMGMLHSLVGPGVNCLGVPIPGWARLGTEERLASLAVLGDRADGGVWILPTIAPGLTVDADQKPVQIARNADEATIFAAQLQASAHARQKIRDLTYNPTYVGKNRSFQPWQLFELSGYIAQIQDVYLQYGADDTLFLIQYLADSGRGQNPYAQMFNLAKSIWDDLDRDFDMTAANAMVVWSMLGSYGADDWNACPTERFARLWDHTRKHGIPTWNGNAMDLFDRWSRALSLSRVEDGLKETTFLFGRRAAAVSDARSRLVSTIEEASFDAILRIVEGTAAASEHMVKSFLSAPDAYVEPYAYANSVGSLPNPVLRYLVDAGGIALHGREAEFERKGYVNLWSIEVGGREFIVSWLVPYAVSPYRHIIGTDAARVADLFALSDFLFGSSGRARSEVQIPGRNFFRDGGIVPFDLLL